MCIEVPHFPFHVQTETKQDLKDSRGPTAAPLHPPTTSLALSPQHVGTNTHPSHLLNEAAALDRGDLLANSLMSVQFVRLIKQLSERSFL